MPSMYYPYSFRLSTPFWRSDVFQVPRRASRQDLIELFRLAARLYIFPDMFQEEFLVRLAIQPSPPSCPSCPSW